MSHFTKKCNSIHLYTNIKEPELSRAMDTFRLFEKKYFQESTETSGNYKAIYECALLQFRNENL